MPLKVQVTLGAWVTFLVHTERYVGGWMLLKGHRCTVGSWMSCSAYTEQ